MGFFDFFRKQEARPVGKCFLCDEDVTEKVYEDGTIASPAKWQLSDGEFLCDRCRKMRHLRKEEVQGHTFEEVSAATVAHGFPSPADFHMIRRVTAYRVTLGFLNGADDTFLFEYDEEHGLLLFPDGHVRQVSQLIQADLYEDGKQVREGSRLAGYTIFDYCTELKILLTFDDLDAPLEEIHFVGEGALVDRIDKERAVYKDMQSFAQKVLAFLRVLIHLQN